jgi:hypothetical protein
VDTSGVDALCDMRMACIVKIEICKRDRIKRDEDDDGQRRRRVVHSQSGDKGDGQHNAGCHHKANP